MTAPAIAPALILLPPLRAPVPVPVAGPPALDMVMVTGTPSVPKDTLTLGRSPPVVAEGFAGADVGLDGTLRVSELVIAAEPEGTLKDCEGFVVEDIELGCVVVSDGLGWLGFPEDGCGCGCG